MVMGLEPALPAPDATARQTTPLFADAGPLEEWHARRFLAHLREAQEHDGRRNSLILRFFKANEARLTLPAIRKLIEGLEDARRADETRVDREHAVDSIVSAVLRTRAYVLKAHEKRELIASISNPRRRSALQTVFLRSHEL